MKEMLNKLKEKYILAFVGGSDISKQKEQLIELFDIFDYQFSENGLIGFKGKEQISSQNLSVVIGEEKLQSIINFCLNYISKLILPAKRGHFIEYRKGMLNVSPVGRDCNFDERDQFEKYDAKHNVRKDFVDCIYKKFDGDNLMCSIGGQISFDLFPKGWDKTFC